MARPKLSITVDPDLLWAVDAYVHEHEGSDRSKVIEQALELWTAAQQNAAMEAQFSTDDVPSSEREAWRSIRRAAAASKRATG
jgi:hypothetical protein